MYEVIDATGVRPLRASRRRTTMVLATIASLVLTCAAAMPSAGAAPPTSDEPTTSVAGATVERARPPARAALPSRLGLGAAVFLVTGFAVASSRLAWPAIAARSRARVGDVGDDWRALL